MKNLVELKKEKNAILGNVDLSGKGKASWGANTNYVGPSNPSTVTTLLDGQPIPGGGRDGLTGRMFGDWWDLTSSVSFGIGEIYIKG